MFINEFNSEKINNCYLYLLIGDDYKEIYKSKIHLTSRHNIFFYVINNQFYVIEKKNQQFCSCNCTNCWHVFKVILDKNQARYVV